MQGLNRAIEIAGGIPQLAQLCGYRWDTRIRNWRYRGRVPASEIPVLRRAVGYRVPTEDFLPASEQ